MEFICSLENGLAVDAAFEKLQNCAEAMAHAIDDMKGCELDDASYEFLDKLWNDCMNINSIDTTVTIK